MTIGARATLAALWPFASGRQRLLAEVNRLASEAAAYRAHIDQLTAVATAQAEQLHARRDFDYQITMAHNATLAGFRDLDPAFMEFYERVKPFTMTSVERLYALFKAVEYVVANRIPGDIVECGVWKGGSCMLAALALIHFGDTSRRIVMFDTFEGHPRPDPERDVDLWGNRAVDDYDRAVKLDGTTEWGAAAMTAVAENMLSTGYPAERLEYIKGKVEETLPNVLGTYIAILRLDTDWHASTAVAMRHLYPWIIEGGILIIDDYGHYQGQRQAVDEYFRDREHAPLLHRIDYSCRVAVKP